MPRPALDLPLTPHERNRVATRAGVVPASVANYLRGGVRVSTVRARIESALRALGHGKLVRSVAA